MKMSSWKVSQEKQKKGKAKQRLRQQKAKAFKRLAQRLKTNNNNLALPLKQGSFFYQGNIAPAAENCAYTVNLATV